MLNLFLSDFTLYEYANADPKEVPSKIGRMKKGLANHALTAEGESDVFGCMRQNSVHVHTILTSLPPVQRAKGENQSDDKENADGLAWYERDLADYDLSDSCENEDTAEELKDEDGEIKGISPK